MRKARFKPVKMSPSLDRPCKKHGPKPLRFPSGGCRECVEESRQRYKAKFTAEEWRARMRRFNEQQKEPGSIARRYRQYYRDERRNFDPVGFVLMRTRGRCRKTGVPFALTREDIVIPERCPVFGTRLEFTRLKRTFNTPSLDRIDSSKGYVKGNVIVVSWRANAVKMDSTPDELLKVGRFYKKLQQDPGRASVCKKPMKPKIRVRLGKQAQLALPM